MATTKHKWVKAVETGSDGDTWVYVFCECCNADKGVDDDKPCTAERRKTMTVEQALKLKSRIQRALENEGFTSTFAEGIAKNIVVTVELVEGEVATKSFRDDPEYPK